MIAQTDLAYIAGLFDGEGSINFTRRPERKKKTKKKITNGKQNLSEMSRQWFF